MARFPRSFAAALIGLTLAPSAPAADITKYLPDGAMLILSVDVKQFLRAPLVRGDDRAFRQAIGEAAKGLEAFGVDPAKDVDRLVLAAGEQLKAAHAILLLLGRFDPAKFQARLNDLARQKKNDFEAISEGGATVYRGRLPRHAMPNATFTPPEYFFLTVLDEKTVAFAADRAALTEALAKRAGTRKTEIPPRVAELVAAPPTE